MKKRIHIVVLLNLLFLTGSYAQTTLSGSFQYGGILRTYRVYIPEVYNPEVSAPLLLNLHGYGSNNIEQEIYGDFRPVADTAGFILVHPNGTLDNMNNRFWNTFGNASVDDIGFLSALIDTLSRGYSIDQNRVYSTGLSNGGFMSYDLACGLSTRIAAVASVAGSIISDHLNSCTATHPMPVMEIHGTADGTVPYNGNGLFASVDSIINHWVQFNSCSAIPEIVQVPDINTTDGCTAEQHIYSGGTFGTRVELFKIIGGGHTWPGSIFTIGVTNRDFNASREIWRFLSQYDMNGLITTGTAESAPATTVFNAWPNPSQGKITVEFPDLSEKLITITNAAGQVMNQSKSSANREVVILQNKGIYFISVKTGTEIQTGKIIRY